MDLSFYLMFVSVFMLIFAVHFTSSLMKNKIQIRIHLTVKILVNEHRLFNAIRRKISFFFSIIWLKSAGSNQSRTAEQIK